MIASSRIKRICIDGAFLLDWLKGMDGVPRSLKVEGLPADAEFVNVFVDRAGNAPILELIIASNEFPHIQPGGTPPIHLISVVDREVHV